MNVLVVGGGIFGATAALELRARGCAVTLVDPGPLPHPLAESTDISKVVRCDYGADEHYTLLGERALAGWRRWNATWRTPRFHETGVAFLCAAPMQPGGFEHDSFALLSRRGHRIERLDAAAIAARFPAYRPGALVDGYYHHDGGWAESGAVVAQLLADAVAAGVTVHANLTVTRLLDDGALAHPTAIPLPDDGALAHPTAASADHVGAAVAAPDRSPAEVHLPADAIVVCAGAWTGQLLPELAEALPAVGQPVFHLRPADPSRFAAARFPVFGADISRTGYYGFPTNRDGLVKIANHGTGLAMTPTTPREVTPAQEAALRAFLAATFPALADAPIVHRRLCVYSDTRDGHFWITRHPDRPRVTIAAGGSGHAFKFAPVLGELIADAALGRANRFAARFRWRPELAAGHRGDAARSS